MNVVLITFLALLLWRLWRFSIQPILNPQEPAELPYLIPWHGFAFFQNASELLEKARHYFATAKEPFAITIFGSTLYIVVQPEHTVEVYKNTEALSMEGFAESLMRSNGMSDAGVRVTYKPLSKNKSGFPNPHGESLGNFVRQMNIHQLYPGKNLDALDARFLCLLNQHLQFTRMQSTYTANATSNTEKVIQVSFMKWCSEIMVRVSGMAYFGEKLAETGPNIAETFLEFDGLGWQVLYQYPTFLTRKLSIARRLTQRSLRAYFQIPQEQRTGAVWLINELENELRALNVSNDDMTALFFNVYWGINTNTPKAAFWMLAHLLWNPSLIDEIREEISPAFCGSEIVDLNHLFHKCPKLDAVWHETLRLSSNAASVRVAMQDTVIGGKLIRKGSRVMIPYRLLHFNENVFGENVHEFNPGRFTAKGTSVTSGPSWRPFGGGKTMCTGRYAAKHATLMFVCLVLHRFDLTIIGNEKFPEADLGRPVLGLVNTKNREELMVGITPRV
ncbi:putative cytochrome p450 [Rostrohypoxylon terebratum]|nr:putative cytochrome p450 [Rostrohypoxylon terebratum]